MLAHFEQKLHKIHFLKSFLGIRARLLVIMATGEQTPPIGERSSAPTPGDSNIASLSTPNGALSSSVVVPQFGSTLNQSFSLKLDRHNFSLWRTVVSSIVRGHRLEGYLTGTTVKPQEMVSDLVTDGQSSLGFQVNLAFEQWVVNDQLLMGWLYGSMTESIAMEVMGCTSSAELWGALESLFGAHSKAKMDEYRTKIQTVRKGSMSMADYLRQKRQWADVLALAGDPYPEALLVSNVLSGLNMEYLPIVLLVESKEKTSWQALQDILLSFDSKLDRLSALSGGKVSNNSSSLTANYANKAVSSGGSSGSGNFRGRGGTNRGRSNFRGRGGRSNGSRPTCQVCGKYGHSAAVCYNRFDENYMGSAPGASNNDGNKASGNPAAFIATPEMLANDAWYADTGASNHVTSEPNTMQQKVKYNGNENLIVGNGDKLTIQHVGTGSIITENNDVLMLTKMLHVPSITKNLISVSKLTKDNNVIVEFSSNYCCVKDKTTKRRILEWSLKGGLYQFDKAKSAPVSHLNQKEVSQHLALSTTLNKNVNKQNVLSLKDKWHRKLGHPSNRVLNVILK